MVWCGVVWCGVVWCGVVWCGEVWCGVVWCGVVWCGVVWCGVVWCGVVWCGVVRGMLSGARCSAVVFAVWCSTMYGHQINFISTKHISASSVLRLKMISNGVAETGPYQNIHSRMYANDDLFYFSHTGIYFRFFDIKTGTCCLTLPRLNHRSRQERYRYNS